MLNIILSLALAAPAPIYKPQPPLVMSGEWKAGSWIIRLYKDGRYEARTDYQCGFNNIHYTGSWNFSDNKLHIKERYGTEDDGVTPKFVDYSAKITRCKGRIIADGAVWMTDEWILIAGEK